MTPASPTDKWSSGDPYERYMGRWSRQLAPRFLHWVDAPRGLRWLDVGCGTGALSGAINDLCAPTALIGVDPSAGFLEVAAKRLPAHTVLHRASALQLPLRDAEVDVAIAALVLNFVPDTAVALSEMVRVTANGGTVAACVWDYAGCMEMIRTYWNAATDLGLVAAGPNQGERFPICEPEALAAAFSAAGLQQVETAGIEIEMRFADFDDYWQPFLGGQGPAPAHAMSLDEPQRGQLRDLLQRRLETTTGSPLVLKARAWAARGQVAGKPV
ncbi:MAG TPA: class I SAM-dependent methyltransferase [Rubrivivax sp.]|nr:class I SAM-dependent methyltransferase [Rubrivivax sp.]